MRFIGDVHGSIKEYLGKIKDVKESFQVGDMNVGFRGVILPSLPGHSFIRGNHDDPALCKKHPNYAGEYGCDRFFYLGGALSKDIRFRLEKEKLTGEQIWWPDEELSESQFETAFNLYRVRTPDLVVTHDCPQFIASRILTNLVIGYDNNKESFSLTQKSLQKFFEFHQPKIWIFGHWHMDLDFQFLGTRFICLNTLSYIDLEV